MIHDGYPVLVTFNIIDNPAFYKTGQSDYFEVVISYRVFSFLKVIKQI